jgi:Asp-tRNA(Asn)/Glu-tRNA(Gln) amidotransferase A subunit family amidase
MTELHELGAADSAAAIARGETSAAELVAALIERIDRTDGELRAWVVVDRERALAEAKRRDDLPKDRRGPLHGVPVGVKDIFDVAGLPTRAGFVPFADRIAAEDCTAVARLRAAGAVILGKTVTTQFAYVDPPPTRNPWNADRTPGGSSSGSGASVAARQVPAALGSQTGGSVLRPAAYNGVVGLKPTYGRVSRSGILPLAWSIDHPGTLTRSVADAALVLRTIAGHDPRDPSSSRAPVPDYVAASRSGVPPRLLVLDDFLERAQPDAAHRFDDAIERLRAAGATVDHGRFPSGAAALIGVHAVVMQAEAAAVHRRLIAQHRDAYAPRIRAFVETGALVPAVDYLDAQRLRRRLRREAAELLASCDCLALPTASGPAPAPDTTGDPSFQGPFSLLGLPAVSLPSGLSADGLPLGLQLVGPAFGEAPLLAAAAWAERTLGPMPGPPAHRL